MSMSAIMSSFGLWVYPTIGMIIFIVVFAIAVARVMGRSRRSEYDQGGFLPLADDCFQPVSTSPRSPETQR